MSDRLATIRPVGIMFKELDDVWREAAWKYFGREYIRRVTSLR